MTSVERFDQVLSGGYAWYWDHDGQPCSLRTWVAEMERPDRFRLETVIGTRKVITAYLGTNDGMPLPAGEAPTSIYGTLAGRTEYFSPTREAATVMHEMQVERLTREQGR